ncbi:MAG: homoserine dehydrogenase [Candidatus Aminicenantes bacterium]|nr:homoserine dehydrogenase [Candidatus Aminicenantes bacterium]
MYVNIAFIGYGTVAQGFTEILLEKESMLKKEHDLQVKVVAVSDIKKSSVYDADGLNMREILSLVQNGKSLEDYPKGIKGKNSLETITQTNADTIIEVTYTDVKTGKPALTHIKTALDAGKHVLSTNKGPAVKQAAELLETARQNNVYYGFEGTVLAGTPALNLARNTLAGNNIMGFKGILNGTTNYILTRMEEGMSYQEALKKAQKLGYAEADPTGDVEGLDAAGKVVILTNVVLKKKLDWSDVRREGITGITPDDIQKAKNQHMRWKLIGQAEIQKDGSVRASVSPEKVPLSDPLAGVNEAINALTFITDELGPVTIVGPGAGRRETGFALLIDLIQMKDYRKQKDLKETGHLKTKN